MPEARNNTPERSRKDVVGELANFIEAGGPGRNNPDVSREAVETEWETFSDAEKLGFMKMRLEDLRRLCEDVVDRSRSGEVFRSETDRLRIDWDGQDVRLVLVQEGGQEEDDADRIAKSVEMRTIVNFFRAAQEYIEKDES